MWGLTLVVALNDTASGNVFVTDAKVKLGVQKGIAEELNIPYDWVRVALWIGTEPRRLAAIAASSITVNVDVMIEIPMAAAVTEHLSNIETALRSVNDATRLSWSTAISENVALETRSMVYAIEVSGVQYSAEDGTTSELATDGVNEDIVSCIAVASSVCVLCILLACSVHVVRKHRTGFGGQIESEGCENVVQAQENERTPLSIMESNVSTDTDRFSV
jgi:hypothetical protein